MYSFYVPKSIYANISSFLIPGQAKRKKKNEVSACAYGKKKKVGLRP